VNFRSIRERLYSQLMAHHSTFSRFPKRHSMIFAFIFNNGPAWSIALILSSASLCASGLPEDDLRFLRQMTLDVLKDSSVELGSNGGGRWPLTNRCGFTLVTPGKNTYSAFWIRDFSMATDSGLVASESISNHVVLALLCQNGAEERKLAHGLRIPPWAVPDHINYDGRACFFPGSYSSGEDQGTGTFGRLPPIDDHYELIHMAYAYWKKTHDTSFIRSRIAGASVFERLKEAFESPLIDPRTELVQTTENERAVGFGFCDAEVHTGKLLFASLLRYRAAGELAEMAAVMAEAKVTSRLHRVRDAIKSNMVPVFSDRKAIGGWLRASTEISRQPDVWGTLFALHLGVLDGNSSSAALETVATATRLGTISFEGGVRQVPTDLDFSVATSWERSVAPLGAYQNGGYWHTASGWLIEALWRTNREQARTVFFEMIEHLRRQDYRKGPGFGAPWEVFGREPRIQQNPVYLASVALPYSVVKDLK
jgi:hypothetical protein